MTHLLRAYALERSVADGTESELCVGSSKAREEFCGTCRGFAISRKSGYKWWKRFCDSGLKGLGEGTRRPRRSPRASAKKWHGKVIELRERYPWWGPKKLRAKLITRHGPAGVPAASTIKKYKYNCWTQSSRTFRLLRLVRSEARSIDYPWLEAFTMG